MLRKIIIVSVLLAAPSAVRADADGDATKGAEVFKKCGACHTLEPLNKVGPSLKGLLGRKAGQVGDYTYSAAMKKAGEGGLLWSEDTLSQYLAAPKAFVPGNKMTFAGLRNPQDIANLLAYLKAQP